MKSYETRKSTERETSIRKLEACVHSFHERKTPLSLPQQIFVMSGLLRLTRTLLKDCRRDVARQAAIELHHIGAMMAETSLPEKTDTKIRVRPLKDDDKK